MRRVGGTRQTALKARLVASARPDLPRRARSGEFREDLFYRLAVVTVTLPPLADRREDLLPAARAVAREAGGPAAFTPAARALLASHAWRGNFRELENVVRRAAAAAAFARAAAIDAAHVELSGPSDPGAVLAAAARAGWSASASSPTPTSEWSSKTREATWRRRPGGFGIARKTLYERRG